MKCLWKKRTLRTCFIDLSTIRFRVFVVEKRVLGRTGHLSSVVTFGCAALSSVSQKDADSIIELVLDHGVNHFDVSPVYGQAELKLRPWMKNYRDEIFLACKTGKRTRKEANVELKRSLERLGVDYLDFYQIHGLDELSDLEIAFGDEGALQMMLEAKEKGVIGNIGITSHKPQIIVEALNRFDLDTILIPVNFVLRKHQQPMNDYEPVLRLARKLNIGVISMKAFAKGPCSPYATWDRPCRPHSTWYLPFDKQDEIDLCLWFALSQDITTVASAGDCRLVPKIIDAAERYCALSSCEQKELVESASKFTPLFDDVRFEIVKIAQPAIMRIEEL